MDSLFSWVGGQSCDVSFSDPLPTRSSEVRFSEIRDQQGVASRLSRKRAKPAVLGSAARSPAQMDQDSSITMKSTTKKSGIGRRRGASKKQSLQASLLVSLAAFSVTLLIIIGCYLGHMSRKSQVDASMELLRDVPLVDRTKKYLKKQHSRDNNSRFGGQAKSTHSEIKRRTDEYMKDDKLGPILKSQVHLFDIDLSRLKPSSSSPRGYTGAKALYCKLNWDLHKYDPPKYPMFRFLVAESGCYNSDNVIKVDIGSLMDKVREYDEMMEAEAQTKHVDDIEGYTHVMPPSGFVFHESRVGSTLVANSLAAMNPEGHRVFSESTPINVALQVCENQGGGCDMDMAANLFRDLVYLMGRTNSPEEKHLFFKVSSAGTKRMKVMREAFPNTPWIFVYRNPVQTMMSHLDPSKIGTRTDHIMAVCTKARRHPPDDLIKLVKDAGRDIEEISDIEFCAAHLVSFCHVNMTLSFFCLPVFKLTLHASSITEFTL